MLQDILAFILIVSVLTLISIVYFLVYCLLRDDDTPPDDDDNDDDRGGDVFPFTPQPSPHYELSFASVACLVGHP